MYRSSSFRSTLNTSYIRGLGMCKVCTEAVHSEALWTRVTSEVWACVKYVPKRSFYSSILLLFRSVALLCCCSSILLAGRNLASSSFSIDRLTSADLGWPRLTSADLGWPRLTSADLDRRKFAHTTSWHNEIATHFCLIWWHNEACNAALRGHHLGSSKPVSPMKRMCGPWGTSWQIHWQPE